jgi:hypothetical protein
VAGRKRQERNITGTLDRFRQLALMIRTGSGNPARRNLASFGNKITQRTDIFIIDCCFLVGTETTDFATAETSTGAARSTGRAISTNCHDYFSFFIVLG